MNKHKKNYTQKGFTLVELILVVAIIIIIFVSIVLILDPETRLAQTRNAARWEETRAIAEAVLKYQTDNNGNLPAGIDENLKMLGTSNTNCSIPCGTNEFTNSFFGITEDSCLNIESELKPNYLSNIPRDPSIGSTGQSHYAIQKDSERSILVVSCNNELQELILQKR